MVTTAKNKRTNQQQTNKVLLTLATLALLVVSAWALSMVFVPLALIPVIAAAYAIVKIWR
ncbi:MAG: hypothetical protein EOO17_01830 [Chloroflexi bacterium]|nr:MAG: hypothetical protein EOO17_01830 [Chloroflexota bacterium]